MIVLRLLSRILRRCSDWKGLGKWKTGLNNHQGGHTHLINKILTLGFNPSEVEAPFSDWPRECSPIPAGYTNLDDDRFFVDWIAEGVKVLPGKIDWIIFLIFQCTVWFH